MSETKDQKKKTKDGGNTATAVEFLGERDDYLSRSARPLQSLVFLFPLLIAYELGTLMYAADIDAGAISTIKARRMILDYVEMLFGQWGYYLPGILVVVVPLGFHLYHKYSWKIYPWALLGMLAESIALTLPLLVFGLAVMGGGGGGGIAGQWRVELVYSVGAGLYEELLFRMLGVGLPVLILVRSFQVDRYTAAALAVVISSALFALYHFNDGNPMTTRKFVYYGFAGAYFGVLYLLRGFGVVAGTHAFYDVLVVAIRYDLLQFER